MLAAPRCARARNLPVGFPVGETLARRRTSSTSWAHQQPANKALAILELKEGASPADIKTAYRKLAKKYHPDLNKCPEAGQKFRAIQDAYDQLAPRPST